jgi:hypothetical protein
MHRAIKFSLILACLFTGFASAGFANIIQDPNASTLDITSPASITTTPTQHGDWIVSGTGSAVGDHASNGVFTISNGSYTVRVTPDFTGHTTTFPSTGPYALTINYSDSSFTDLTILVNGSPVATFVGSGAVTTFNITSTSESLVFEFSGSGNNNNFSITNVNLVSTAPEPKSIGAAALLLGLVGCTERHRLGGLMSWISGRFTRLFS